MGPITVMARRPSLRIPVDPEDVTEEVGSAQSIARVSAFDSETPRDSVEPGDPPQWMLEGLAQELRRRLNLNLFNFDLICPTWDRAGAAFPPPFPTALLSDLRSRVRLDLAAPFFYHAKIHDLCPLT